MNDLGHDALIDESSYSTPFDNKTVFSMDEHRKKRLDPKFNRRDTVQEKTDISICAEEKKLEVPLNIASLEESFYPLVRTLQSASDNGQVLVAANLTLLNKNVMINSRLASVSLEVIGNVNHKQNCAAIFKTIIGITVFVAISAVSATFLVIGTNDASTKALMQIYFGSSLIAAAGLSLGLWRGLSR